MDMEKFFLEMVEALYLAQLNHKPLNSAHEVYAVILEELDEFWDQVRLKPENRSTIAMRKELVQIATMCWRTVKDLEL